MGLLVRRYGLRIGSRGIALVPSFRVREESMMMKPNLRKFALTAHVTVAVGWIGAVFAYLVLVVAAMADQDEATVRAAWLAMDLMGWYLIVPAALASLVTGIIMALGTPWGLVRHYWVAASLALTIVAAGVLLAHMPTVSTFAALAHAADPASAGQLRSGLRGELLHAGVGVLVLLVIEALNVYKPQGMTAYGRRRVSRIASPGPSATDARPKVGAVAAGLPRWVQVLGLHAIGVALLFAILHLAGGGGWSH